ncbi:hypothetical protein [Vibrio gallicus]|uniref:hypothetical protein n=1 Tax=Vibrio gallicus TaxID=190897 RepID=UPI0021C41EAD|nr:hypothetical protein [Vibrio gallicus]
MINLLPWREARFQSQKRLMILSTITPILLLTCIHGLFIGFMSLQEMKESELLSVTKVEVGKLREQVKSEQAYYLENIKYRDLLMDINEQLRTFHVTNLFEALPSTLPKGVFIHSLQCELSLCLAKGQVENFLLLDELVSRLRNQINIESVTLEALHSSSTPPLSTFELNLLLQGDRDVELAIH